MAPGVVASPRIEPKSTAHTFLNLQPDSISVQSQSYTRVSPTASYVLWVGRGLLCENAPVKRRLHVFSHRNLRSTILMLKVR